MVKGWEVDQSLAQPQECAIAIEWFESKFNQSLVEINDHFSKFRMSDALQSVYKLIWDDFCAWYLEMIKPEYGKPIDGATFSKTVSLFESVLKVLHPFMPFITEELWSELSPRKVKENIIVASWPQVGPMDTRVISEAAVAFDLIAQVRNLRNSKGLSPKEAISLYCNKTDIQRFWLIVKNWLT